jgi:trans-2,3-dihydro-3-hydroxyanthranilate isomerase
MRYRYFLCDVFSGVRFGGNPLAVLPDARGLSAERMQQIAREFNFSETTFVLPAEQGHTRRVRIFTPSKEVPFAGHPNIGTAFALAQAGELGEIAGSLTVAFEEQAGLVPIRIERRDKQLWCELSAPQRLSLGASLPASALAAAVSLRESEVRTTAHLPQQASVGLPFLIAELVDLDALRRARVNAAALDAVAAAGLTPDVHLYARAQDGFDLRARMFAPLDGVPEDPATGSANCALAGLLAHVDPRADGDFAWRIAQGVEMGRPSALDARAEKRGGAVVATRIGGASVLFGEGWLEVD